MDKRERGGGVPACGLQKWLKFILILLKWKSEEGGGIKVDKIYVILRHFLTHVGPF